MAAYAALVSLINDLEFIPNHPVHSFSFDSEQIASLSQIVNFLVDFMESYDSHGCNREAAEVLESRIASSSYAAHDVVESHVVDQIQSGSTLCGKPRSYFFLDLQKAIDNLGYVKRKAIQFGGKSGMKAAENTYLPTTSSEPRISGKNRMVGFDAVADRLMGMLVGESLSRLVIPIVGMGGMGKTTLAKNAFEHSHVKYHFDVCHWATISQQYSAHTILTQLVFGESKSSCGGTVNELGEQLHKGLWCRRYLIILDDMWSLDAWDEIQMFLPHNDNGSRVIVTTRLSDLATKLRSSPINMEFLDEDQSWKLFCKTAFDEEECPLELAGIGKKIVRKCQGLPLSIVVIGGYLRKTSSAIEWWEKVANLMNPILSSEEGEKCMNIISLSYDHLPICLKPCLLYMGIFEEDRRIIVSELVRLWVSEGFVRSKEGVSLEEVAEDYVKDLIDRNLVIVRERRWNGQPEYCSIHDIVREFCIKVGKKDKFLCVVDSSASEGLSRERRIVIPYWKQEYDFINVVNTASLLRTLRWHYNNDLPLEPANLLRVLESPCSLAADFQPLNLRYSVNVIDNLLGSICLFWNLQTLKIRSFFLERISAPLEIWEMIQLRHLDISRLVLLDPPPNDLQKRIVLKNLQTLKGVCDLRLTEEVCKRIPNIKHLQAWYYVEDCSDYYLYNLCRFTKLESLALFGRPHDFAFPSSLQELKLIGCSLWWEDVGVIIESLPHLGFLSLSQVQGGTWSLAEVEFPRLKYLDIRSSPDLIYWNANSSHFPALEALHFNYLPKLSEIPFNIGDIPTLVKIKLYGCSVAAAVSAMRILVEQESCGNHDLQVLVEFDNTEEVERFQKMVQEEELESYGLCTKEKSYDLHLFHQYIMIRPFEV